MKSWALLYPESRAAQHRRAVLSAPERAGRIPAELGRCCGSEAGFMEGLQSPLI